MTKPNYNGFSMIEVLVTIVILMIGLLGLAGLQARALTAQMESYQRSQALLLLKDMADRIDTNRTNIDLYINKPVGTGISTCPSSPESTVASDLCEWHNALLGSAEKQGASSIGAMIGARGCIYQISVPDTVNGVAGQYLVVVSWQGMNSTAAPDASTTTSPGKCGQGLYKNKDGIADEKLHRVISLPINIATLSAP